MSFKVCLVLPVLLVIVIETNLVTSSVVTPINGWLKYACTAENIKQSRTYYCDQEGRIHCLPGWSREEKLCKVPVCDINGQTCVHGNCSKPYTCDCEIGWTGQFCDKCVCLPGCVNGYCNRSMECICKPGWHGMLCDKPICDGCVHGTCVMPGMCVCEPGWSGPNCTICEQREDCVFGRCINEPFECSCYDGYTGSSCEIPICKKGCHPVNGQCMMPETCWCRDGWKGENCTECVPYWNCQNGYCNKPYECICKPGFFGKDCSETKTTNGNWGPWTAFTSCSATCGEGTKRRERLCNSPPKSGNGTYCSLDGSKATDVVACNLGPCSGTVANVDGNWGQWSAFSACSVSCGNGTQTRTRECNSPPRSGNGTACAGPATQTSPCTANRPCPTNGGYTEWTPFSPCTAKCIGETGDRVRRRYCTNPAPLNGGLSCVDQGLGPDREQLPCTGEKPRQTTDPTADCFSILS